MASSTGSTPTLGVEEEFLLVDPTTGAPVALNRAVAERAARDGVELHVWVSAVSDEDRALADVIGQTVEPR